MTGKVMFIERSRRCGKRLEGESLVDAVLRRAHFHALISSRKTPNPQNARTAVVVEMRSHPAASRGVAAAPSLTEAMTTADTVSSDGGDDA